MYKEMFIIKNKLLEIHIFYKYVIYNILNIIFFYNYKNNYKIYFHLKIT